MKSVDLSRCLYSLFAFGCAGRKTVICIRKKSDGEFHVKKKTPSLFRAVTHDIVNGINYACSLFIQLPAIAGEYTNNALLQFIHRFSDGR